MWRIHINLTYFPQHIPVFVNAHVPLFLGVYRKIEKHNNAYIVCFVTLSFNEQNTVTGQCSIVLWQTHGIYP